MEHDYIHSLAPTNLGLDKITAEDIRNNPKLADVIIKQREKGTDDFHTLTNALIAKDVIIEQQKKELEKSPNFVTRLSITILNIVSAVCVTYSDKEILYFG